MLFCSFCLVLFIIIIKIIIIKIIIIIIIIKLFIQCSLISDQALFSLRALFGATLIQRSYTRIASLTRMGLRCRRFHPSYLYLAGPQTTYAPHPGKSTLISAPLSNQSPTKVAEFTFQPLTTFE